MDVQDQGDHDFPDTDGRAQEALLPERHSIYRQGLDNLPYSYIIVTIPEYRYFYLNSAAGESMRANFGTDPGEAIGKHPWEIIRNWKDIFMSTCEEAVTACKPIGPRSFAYERDGRLLTWEATAIPHMDECGQVTHVALTAVNVSERVQAQHAEERLTGLMDHNPSLVFLKDESGRYVYMNKAYLDEFAHSDDWYGRTDFDFWPRESAELFRKNDADVLRAGKTQQFMEDSRDQKGRRHCWLCYKFPFSDSQGRKYVGGIGIDATGRVEAEEALCNSERQLRLAMQAAGMCTWELEITTSDIRFSGDAERALGFHCTEGDDVFSRIDRYVVPEDAVRHREALARTLRGEGDLYSVVRVISPETGGIVWMETQATPVRDDEGAPLRIVGIARNITESKEAEVALAKANREKSDILESISDCFYALDKDLRFVYVNGGAEEIWGLSRDDLIGRKIDDVFAGLIDLSMSKFHQALDEQTPQHYEIYSKVANKWGDMSVYPTPDGVSVYFHDITKRKQAEEAVRNAERLARADLEAMSILREMSAMYAHEDNLKAVLGRIVDAAIAISGSDFGNIQLLDPDSGDLRIAAHRGFPDWWLNYWSSVAKGQGSCGTALRRGERIIVEDVERSPIFAGTPGLDIQLRAGVRAVQSTPLISRSGRALGMFSTHYRTPQRPDERTLSLLDLLARQAADLIEREQIEEAVRESEEQFRRSIEDAPIPIIMYAEDGQVLQISKAWAELTGCTAADMRTFDAWLSRAYGDGSEVVQDHMRELFKGARRSMEVELQIHTSSGELRYWAFRASAPGSLRDGRRFVVGMAVDITDRKQFELRQSDLLHRESRIARTLQDALVPPALPERLYGYEIASIYEPASDEADVGGDFYDVFDLGEGRFGVLIGDVVGKGLQAAIHVAAARHAIRSYAYLNPSPAYVLARANDALCRSSEEETGMLTVFLGVIDTTANVMTYASAGHESPLVRRADGRIVQLPGVGGLALAVADSAIYTESTCDLNPGDAVVAITDGITEARRPAADLFGVDGLIGYLAETRHGPIEETARGVLAVAKSHAGGKLQDDVAILVFGAAGSETADPGPVCAPAVRPSPSTDSFAIAESGSLTKGSSKGFQRRLRRAAQSSGEVTVDLQSATFVDTSILNGLASTARKMKESGRRLRVLTAEGSYPLRALELVQFQQIMDVEVGPASAGEEIWTPLEEQRLELSRNTNDMEKCRQAAFNVAMTVGFSSADAWDITSAVVEACANAAEHGSKGANREVEITVRALSDRFEAVVRDHGAGFTCPEETPMPPPTEPRGRGIPIMRLHMDEVRFSSDNGCEVTLTRYAPDRSDLGAPQNESGR